MNSFFTSLYDSTQLSMHKLDLLGVPLFLRTKWGQTFFWICNNLRLVRLDKFNSFLSSDHPKVVRYPMPEMQHIRWMNRCNMKQMYIRVNIIDLTKRVVQIMLHSFTLEVVLKNMCITTYVKFHQNPIFRLFCWVFPN